jgi:cellulose synthase/poly-beta-1,6-N-acetylglucosamine synthase-like glycosyltransferase
LTALVVSVAVQLMALGLFAIGIAEFLSLLKGSFVLRRIARAGAHNYTAVLLKSPLVPAVSTIAIPPDASPESIRFARRLLELHFGRNEVVVVLDGPSESEMAVWHQEFHLCPSARTVSGKLPTAPVRGVYESKDPIRIVVIAKDKGGPVDAWNAAVNACSSPVIGFLDPASDFLPDVLLRLIQPMLESTGEIIAVCSGVPAPAGPGLNARFGALQSLRDWMTRGAAFSDRNLTLPFPGSAALVRRSSVLEAGGFTAGLLELFLRLHGVALAARKPYQILFVPEPITQARTPVTRADLYQQVRRDQREIAGAFFRRVSLAGPFGWPVLRSLFCSCALRPWLETLAYILAIAGLVIGWVNLPTVLLLLLATVGMGIVLSMAAVVFRELAEPNSPDDRRLAALFFAAIPENLGYRQLRNLWLIAGFRAGAPEKANRGKETQVPPAVSAASPSV